MLFEAVMPFSAMDGLQPMPHTAADNAWHHRWRSRLRQRRLTGVPRGRGGGGATLHGRTVMLFSLKNFFRPCFKERKSQTTQDQILQ